jgi:DNA-binding transcriptional LysR family regulator
METAAEIFVTAGGGAPEVVDWWVVDPRPDGSRPRRGPTADSVEGLLELVAAGAGVNIAGESASTHYRREELAYIRIDDIEPATIVLCSLNDTRNPMVQTFRETALSLSTLDDAGA